MDNGGLVGGQWDCSVGCLASRDIRVAALFVRLGFNLADEGTTTVAEACRNHQLDFDLVDRELASLELPDADSAHRNPPWWALDEVCDLIVERHHGHFRHAIPVIRGWLATIVERESAVHPAHPDLLEAQAIFDEVSEQLLSHLAKEENILFPAFAALAHARREGRGRPALPFPTVLHPIRVMDAEHERVKRSLARLRQMTNGFVPRDAADETWVRCTRELARFDRDLDAHMHFEDDLLFPRALDLENQLH